MYNFQLVQLFLETHNYVQKLRLRKQTSDKSEYDMEMVSPLLSFHILYLVKSVRCTCNDRVKFQLPSIK